MSARAPHFVVIGTVLTPTPAVAAVQVSRRSAYASDTGSDGIHVWSCEAVSLGPWEDDFPGPAAAQMVELAYLRSNWHDDAPVALQVPAKALPLLVFRNAALYGAVSYGLQANHRQLEPTTNGDGILAVTGRRHTARDGVVRIAGRMKYSAGRGTESVRSHFQGSLGERYAQALAIGIAIAGARKLLAGTANTEPANR